MMPGGSIYVGVDDMGLGVRDFGSGVGRRIDVLMYYAFGEDVFIVVVKLGGFFVVALQFLEIVVNVGD